MARPDLVQEMLKKTQQPQVAEAALEALRGRQGGPQLPPLVLRIPRPGSGSNAPHTNFVFDLALPYLVVYLELGQEAQVSLSADPFVAFPLANFLIQKGIKVVRETDEAMAKRVSSPVLTLSPQNQSREDVLSWLEEACSVKSKL
ncbi:unnamed protein product [Polarella glacialis]|uniref:Uncharacterized protein n=1 Tax=Polarella glacialis TaxID=89957 RepID=A0A813D8D4_POLGL|nr:unnamed protein product [Polarella glacialis]